MSTDEAEEVVGNQVCKNKTTRKYMRLVKKNTNCLHVCLICIQMRE